MPLLDMLSSSGARIKSQGACGCVGETTPKYYRRHWKYCKNFMVAILVGADPPHTRKEFRLEPTTEKDPSTRNHVMRPIGEHTEAEMQAGRIYVNTGSWSEMFLNRFFAKPFSNVSPPGAKLNSGFALWPLPVPMRFRLPPPPPNFNVGG